MSTCPLSKIEGIDGARVRVEGTATGWHVASTAGVRARGKGFEDALRCRIGAGVDREVVQLAAGMPASTLCNALYSPEMDSALVFQADDLALTPVVKAGELRRFNVECGGPLTVTLVQDYMRVHRNLPWFEPLDRDQFERPPAGWCSWYYYYLNISEEEVVKNTDWLAEHLKPYGCEWVQIDDGWQGRGEGYGTNRDWLVTSNKDFPNGMKWSADYIRGKGFRPGIWCIPFTQSNPTMYEDKLMLFVRNEDGSSPGERAEPLPYDWMPEEERQFEWAGRYFIDPTGKEGQKYLRRLFQMLCDDWGYEYVKIDAQGMMAGFYNEHRRRLVDPSLDGDRAYRDGLAVLKSVMRKDRFLLNCAHGFSSIGLCEGIRIGGDVGLDWKGMQPAIDSTLQWLFLNTLAFYTDPDVVCVREPLPLEMARVWATLVGITGQLLMASDKMYELPDERVELLRRIFPVGDIRPMELYPITQKPGIFDLKVAKPGVGEWDVVALFNWSDTDARTFDLSPARLGLKPGAFVCLDAWTGQPVHEGDGSFSVEVPPASCRVVTYWAVSGRPRAVGTSRHLTQGLLDLEDVKWSQDRLRLTGVSQVVGGDPYQVRVHVPSGYRVKTKGVEQEGSIAVLPISQPESGEVCWRIDFARVKKPREETMETVEVEVAEVQPGMEAPAV